MFKEYLKQISIYERITNEETVTLLETSGPEAHEVIFKRTLWLIVYLIRRWRDNAEKNRIEIMDLVQAGNTGLLKAIKKFDIQKSRDFMTYATLYAKSYIEKEFYAYMPYSRVHSKKMLKEHKSLNPTVSWDDPVSINESGEEQTYQDIVGEWDDYERSDIEHEREQLLLKIANKRAFHPLASRIMTLRFQGEKENSGPLSLSQVAGILDISKERVRQIEKATYASIGCGK